MQGWIDQEKAIPNSKYNNDRFDFAPCSFVKDLYEDQFKNTEIPAPALAFKWEQDGTATPSMDGITQLTDKSFIDKWDWATKERLWYTPVSMKNAPNMGEFNNLIPPMYLEPDPNVQNQFQAAIFILVESNQTSMQLVNSDARRTRYDNRNFTASVLKNRSMYEVVKVVKNGFVQHAVDEVDDLDLIGEDGQPITSQWLEEQLDYLNGKKLIGDPEEGATFTARTVQE